MISFPEHSIVSILHPDIDLLIPRGSCSITLQGNGCHVGILVAQEYEHMEAFPVEQSVSHSEDCASLVIL